MDRDRRSQHSSKLRERRLRAKYRRNIKVAIAVSAILGLAVGFGLGRITAPAPAVRTSSTVPTPTGTPESTPDASATPTPTAEVQATGNALSLETTASPTSTLLPTVTPTVEPTVAPTTTPEVEAVIVPFGTTQTISAQIHNDGTVRKTNDSQTYETLNFTMKVTRYLTPEYYAENYSDRYQLQGNEAGIEFELTLNDYMGSQTIVPQDLFVITLETASGVADQGYVLTSTELENNSLSLTTNIPTMGYKRFAFSESVGDMAYLKLTCWVDGEPQVYKFEVGDPIRPTAAPTSTPKPYETLQSGDSGSDVMRLQERLVELGYLDDEADGRFGAKTSDAIRAAQKDFGMTETGIADSAFQERLYAEATE